MNSVDIPIIGDSVNLPQDDPQFTLNLYAEKTAEDAYTLKPTPGTVLDSQLTISGAGRGIVTVAGRHFGVRGGYFQEKVSGAWVVRGALSSDQGKVGIIFNLPPTNEGQIMVVDDTKGYVFDLATNLWTLLTGAGGDNFLGGGSQVAFCAGRAFVFKPGTTQFQCSGLYDFKTWSTSAYATALSLNTPILSIISNGNLLYLFSSDGFEVWQDQGLAVLPVSLILSGDKIGIVAPQSALFSERFVYWLGGTAEGRGVVYRHSGGGRPERISDHSTERNIADLTTPEDAVAISYQSLGHVFYILNFQAGNRSMAFDSSTNLWADRCQRDALSGALSALPYIGTAIIDGDIVAIDSRDGKVVQLDDSVYTDQGNPIIRERILPVTPKEGDFLTFYQSAELFGQIGNTPVGEEDPQIMMKYSADRGQTWSLEDWQQSGGNNSYEGRTRWVGLGSAYGLAFWFRVVASQYISWRLVRVRCE